MNSTVFAGTPTKMYLRRNSTDSSFKPFILIHNLLTSKIISTFEILCPPGSQGGNSMRGDRNLNIHQSIHKSFVLFFDFIEPELIEIFGVGGQLAFKLGIRMAFIMKYFGRFILYLLQLMEQSFYLFLLVLQQDIFFIIISILHFGSFILNQFINTIFSSLYQPYIYSFFQLYLLALLLFLFLFLPFFIMLRLFSIIFVQVTNQIMEPAKLNQTFIPKQILKKTIIANQNAILATNQFQKTGGNPYIQFDPIQVKFNGYELGKSQSAIVKIINKSPIPQRLHILPPTQPGFSIRVNKKGPIAAGMSQNIQISFISDVYKYQYDVVKINSETGNFVIPVYAYPSIPKINQIFPKIIDFGNVIVNESNSYLYPIVNPIPMDFSYEFKYIQQSTAFIITPIRGAIPSNSTQNIQMTFIPSEKKTFVAEVIFVINQFDFEPLRIKIFGTGIDKKQGLGSTKRIKSSKLNPILKTDSKKVELPDIQNTKVLDLNITSSKKPFLRSRTSYPKLLKKGTNTINQNLSITQIDKLDGTIKKQGQREYMGQFSKIQELDKEKQIKFMQYLGDHPLNEDEIEFEQKIIEETKKARLEALKQFCVNRHEPDLKGDGQVDLTKFVQQTLTWDIKKNNELKIRKQKLKLFMKAGSKIITKHRLIKRLQKIKEFLKDCKSKQDVKRKVQQDFTKSRDQAKKGFKVNKKLNFNADMISAASFPLQFKEQGQSIKKTFDPEGSTKFDDEKILKQIDQHQAQVLNYSNFNYPSDFIYMTRSIPSARRSAQQQYPLKTPTLPNYEPILPSSVHKLPLKVPTHQFIYNNFEIGRYKTPNPVDQKDPEYIINSSLDHIEDEFQGWSKGDMEVLKTKFQRNMGCQFSGISLYNYPEIGDVGFIGELAKNLPKVIGNMQVTKDDRLQQGDSDEEKLNNIQVEKPDTLIGKIEQNSAKAKQRRQKGNFNSWQLQLLSTIDRNLLKIKMKNITLAIDKISEYNKWSDKKQNKVLI